MGRSNRGSEWAVLVGGGSGARSRESMPTDGRMEKWCDTNLSAIVAAAPDP